MTTRTPYILAEKKTRQTGLAVQVLNLIHPESEYEKPDNGERFGVRCTEHDFMIPERNRREAHRMASHPLEWCTNCKRRYAAQERAAARRGAKVTAS